MDNILNNLYYVFKRANPTATDEEINAQIKGLNAPTQSSQDSLGIPSDTAMELSIPSANGVSSSYDVNVSDNTVTNNGNPDTLASGLGTGKSVPDVMEMPLPETPNMPTESPMPVKDSVPSKELKDTPTGKPEPSISNVLSSSNDSAERDKMMEDLKHKRMLGGIASLGAGIGDAVQAGASALGAHGNMNSQQNLIENQRKDEARSKEEFESKLKNDPNSDISKSYREIVTQIAPELAQNPNFMKMSAQAIGEKLPLIDTMMRAKATKDSKEMSLEAMKEHRRNIADQKHVALSEKEDQFNQRRWERFGAAVNPMNAGSRRAIGVAAINNMRADRLLQTAQNKNITSQDISNLVADLQGIYKGGVPDQVMLKHGDYPSIQRKAGEILGTISGNPRAIHSPQLIDHLVQLTKEIRAVDNKAINDNMGLNAVIFDELQKSDPQKFERAMKALSEMTVSAADTPSIESAATPTGMRKTKSGINYSVE